jgi:hypothetical protein
LCRETGALVQTRLVWFDRTGAISDTISAPLAFARSALGAAEAVREW